MTTSIVPDLDTAEVLVQKLTLPVTVADDTPMLIAQVEHLKFANQILRASLEVAIKEIKQLKE